MRSGFRDERMEQEQVIIPLREPFVDERGIIQNLIDAPFTSAAMITCVKGAVRGNHYHKIDYHYCWLQRGGLIYAHRPVGSTAPPQQWVIKPGQLFYTPPRYEHIMVFTADSVFFAFAKNNREMANYEADTVRIPPLLQR
jgi:oxalate decarboxylase/phosphoglucose isomerase-like protein (cupin superfamily)